VLFGIVAALCSMKLIGMRKERQDDRIKRFEDEIEALKKSPKI